MRLGMTWRYGDKVHAVERPVFKRAIENKHGKLRSQLFYNCLCMVLPEQNPVRHCSKELQD